MHSLSFERLALGIVSLGTTLSVTLIILARFGAF